LVGEGGGPPRGCPALSPPQPAPTTAEPVVAGGAVVRDAQLDRYLRAHRDYATALPGSLPGGAGRNVTTVSLQR
jgi:sigma-E factor negative regulatory protein RseA